MEKSNLKFAPFIIKKLSTQLTKLLCPFHKSNFEFEAIHLSQYLKSKFKTVVQKLDRLLFIYFGNFFTLVVFNRSIRYINHRE